MKPSELIKKLQLLPDDTILVVTGVDSGGYDSFFSKDVEILYDAEANFALLTAFMGTEHEKQLDRFEALESCLRTLPTL